MRIINSNKLLFVLSFLTLLFVFASFYRVGSISSAASHVVISEVQFSGGTGASTKEFIELYNPTQVSVDLQGWKIAKKNELGTQEDFLVSTISGTIPARGFFLIGSESYNNGATVSADVTYSTESASLTNDNTVLLYDNLSGVIDKVGFGNAVDNETESETNPAAGASRERKASSTSTSQTMLIGGTDEFMGNGEDTDNNDVDFLARAIPQPQNSQSQLEPVIEATPTPTASPVATPEPSSTPTSTPEPTSTPTQSPSPTPTATPEPTESPEPSSTPTATPIATSTPKPGRRLGCTMKFVHLSFGFFSLRMPLLHCQVN